jgi:hypothetical protein
MTDETNTTGKVDSIPRFFVEKVSITRVMHILPSGTVLKLLNKSFVLVLVKIRTLQ